MIGIDSNIDAMIASLTRRAERQIPFAASRAANDTGADVLAMVPRLMEKVFDRPTPYAKGAFMLYRGDKNDPYATVMRKPDALARRFLQTEAQGGPRRQKGFEKLLSFHVAFEGTIYAAIPADGAKLDQYGNWSSGERNQVLSLLRAQSDQINNATARSKKKARGRANYFVPKSGLAPGVYKRTASGTLSIILAFSPVVPKYEARFPFQKAAAELARERFPIHFRQRMAEAMKSAQ